MRIFTELLFQHGHIADVALARQLAEPEIAADVATDATPEPAETAQSGTEASKAAPRRRAEKRMERRARHLVQAMTALSPFR